MFRANNIIINNNIMMSKLISGLISCFLVWCQRLTMCSMMLQPQMRSLENDQIKQHHSVILTLSPKPLFDLKGKIKLQLHTFLPMMSWKCMLTAWSTDCSASKVINPKPSQRPRVNQGSRGGCDNTRWRTVLGFSRVRIRQDWARGSWGSDDVADSQNNTNPRLMPGGLKETVFLYCAGKYLVKITIQDCLAAKHEERREQQLI